MARAALEHVPAEGDMSYKPLYYLEKKKHRTRAELVRLLCPHKGVRAALEFIIAYQPPRYCTSGIRVGHLDEFRR